MIAGGHGNPNPNANWMDSRGNIKTLITSNSIMTEKKILLGFYLFYLLFVTVFHLILLSIFSTPMAWTLTLQTHNFAHFIFLHMLKGAPWMSVDSHEHIRETHWEQIDEGKQWSRQRKILFALPIILFLLTCLYTQNNETHFIFNFLSLVLCIIPKLPAFHHRRLFGINKY